jgi:hypothetical protein
VKSQAPFRHEFADSCVKHIQSASARYHVMTETVESAVRDLKKQLEEERAVRAENDCERLRRNSVWKGYNKLPGSGPGADEPIRDPFKEPTKK